MGLRPMVLACLIIRLAEAKPQGQFAIGNIKEKGFLTFGRYHTTKEKKRRVLKIVFGGCYYWDARREQKKKKYKRVHYPF